MKKSIFKTVGFALLAVLFVLVLSVYAVGLFGINKYLVVSGSMEPNISTGSVAVVDENVPFDDVEIGDVIVFRYKDMNIIHRVIDETMIDGERHLKTKGDANECDDGYLTATDNYLGTTLFHIPKGFGFMVDFYNLIYR